MGIPIARSGQCADDGPRGLAERHYSGTCIGIWQGDRVLSNAAPAEILHFASATAGERQQPDSGDGLGLSVLAGVERSPEPREFVGVEKPGDVTTRVRDCAADRLYLRTGFASEYQRVEHLFMFHENMRAPLDISTLGGRRKRRRIQRQFEQV